MKYFIIKIFSFFSLLLFNFKKQKGEEYSGSFFQVKVKSEKTNNIKIKKSQVFKSSINIVGKANKFESAYSFIEGSQIFISGKGNELRIGKGVKLRKANIIIRGTNCKILIGNRTTFGEVRIVNVGFDNSIIIGEDCLFSDKIEIWASDTHSIYDSQGEWINPEKPIRIEDRVWIGSAVTILKGVTVGNGSIIGMGTLVTKDIDPMTLNIGIPNKTIQRDVHWKLDYPISE